MTDNREIKLLIVDDEEQMRRVLRYIIENSEFSYLDIKEAASVEKALNIVNQEKSDIVICDYLLDHMSGIEFFSRYSDISPFSVRILISGNVNYDELRSAIERGDIFKFISKPFNEEEIIGVLKEAIDKVKENRKRQDLINRLKDF